MSPEPDERARAVAVNESRFRAINERLAAELDGIAEDGDELEFVCECARLDCRATARMTAEEYEQVRAGLHHFAIVPGHQVPDLERVVGGCNPRYAVVEKAPPTHDLVEMTYPR